jgi:hypothetical protein
MNCLIDKLIDNHSPNANGIQAWRVKPKTHSLGWRVHVFFSPFIDSSFPDHELFSDLASETTKRLVGSVPADGRGRKAM